MFVCPGVSPVFPTQVLEDLDPNGTDFIQRNIEVYTSCTLDVYVMLYAGGCNACCTE